jgi:SAM-dependent methyltransferase
MSTRTTTGARLRRDSQRLKAQSGEPRADERLRAHYDLETELAARLMRAPRAHRAEVYGQVYGELFANLADHPQHTKRQGASDRLDTEFRRVAAFLDPRLTFLEIGCGDGALSIRAAGHAGESLGMDVTDALIPKTLPGNFHFVRTDGVTIPLDDGAVGFAYSNQLMEHLHPDDAAGQLKEIARVLAPGGVYYCATPSRVSGPHDISRYFDYEARGLHLKEYDYGELRRLFRAAGFRKVQILLGSGARARRAPYIAVRAFERLVLALPKGLRARVAGNPYVSGVLGIQILGTK